MPFRLILRLRSRSLSGERPVGTLPWLASVCATAPAEIWIGLLIPATMWAGEWASIGHRLLRVGHLLRAFWPVQGVSDGPVLGHALDSTVAVLSAVWREVFAGVSVWP